MSSRPAPLPPAMLSCASTAAQRHAQHAQQGARPWPAACSPAQPTAPWSPFGPALPAGPAGTGGGRPGRHRCGGSMPTLPEQPTIVGTAVSLPGQPALWQWVGRLYPVPRNAARGLKSSRRKRCSRFSRRARSPAWPRGPGTPCLPTGPRGPTGPVGPAGQVTLHWKGTPPPAALMGPSRAAAAAPAGVLDEAGSVPPDGSHRPGGYLRRSH